MLLALGAASTAVDALKSLMSSKSSSSQSNAANPASLFDAFSSSSPSTGTSASRSSGSQISPETMSALLAAQGQASADGTSPAPKSRSDSLKDLFSLIDGNGDGKITKSEFEDALGAGGTNLTNADKVFSKLDKDGDGSVSLDEMMSAFKGKGHHRHAHRAGGAGDGSNSDPLLQALQGATTTSVTNGDGTVTTSMTYADGSKVSMTSAASGSTATSSYNFIEQMIQRQSQAISASTTASLSVSA